MPDKSNKVKTYTFVSIKDFRLIDWFSVHKFWDKQKFAATSLPDHIDPTVTYIAKHPFLTARLEGYSHNQV